MKGGYRLFEDILNHIAAGAMEKMGGMDKSY